MLGRGQGWRDRDPLDEDLGSVGLVAKGDRPAAGVEAPRQAAVPPTTPKNVNHLVAGFASDDSTAAWAEHAPQHTIDQAWPETVLALFSVFLQAHLGAGVRDAGANAGHTDLRAVIALCAVLH